MATSLSITMASKEIISKLPDLQKPILELQLVLYIYYLVQFKEKLVQAFINLGSERNAIRLIFAKKLGLWIQKTEVDTQKIGGSSLEIFEIVIVSFSMDNKASKPWFFEEIFLIANIIIDIVLDISFLMLSNAEINFLKQNLTGDHISLLRLF